MGLGKKIFLMMAGIAILSGAPVKADVPDPAAPGGDTADAPGTQAQLRTVDGMDKDSLRCTCQQALGACILGQKAEKVVTFVLPMGYRRLSFAQTVNPQGVRSGGTVAWESDDPHDARVRLECFAELLSSVDLTVSSVLGVKE